MQKKKALRTEAVARMRAHATPLLDLAREFGVSTNTLRTWLKDGESRARSQEEARRVATALSATDPSSASQRERLLIHALEYSPATIIVTDTEGNVAYANPKFEETTGYAIDEVIGKNPRILKSGETSPTEYRDLWKTIRGGKEWRGIFHNRRKDGALYWERASISPVLDAEGKITHFMAVKEDITELMETELASRKNAATFGAVFASLPFAVLVVDQPGTIRFANNAAEIMFGVTLLAGTRFNNLNLRWVDASGYSITNKEHPLAQLFSPATNGQEIRARMGVVPPTGGVRWTDAVLRMITLPETQERMALLTLSMADAEAG
jgi:PAS domain S-box-containing protein